LAGIFPLAKKGGRRQYPCGLVPSDPTMAKGKSHRTLRARARDAVWLRSLLGQSPLRGFSLAGAWPSRHPLFSRGIPQFSDSLLKEALALS